MLQLLASHVEVRKLLLHLFIRCTVLILLYQIQPQQCYQINLVYITTSSLMGHVQGMEYYNLKNIVIVLNER